MAYASGIKKYEKKVTEVAVNNGANLTLSKDEAETLLVVLGKVGGDPWESRRKHASAILEALRSAGVVAPKVPSEYDDMLTTPEVKGAITFNVPSKATNPNLFLTNTIKGY